MFTVPLVPRLPPKTQAIHLSLNPQFVGVQFEESSDVGLGKWIFLPSLPPTPPSLIVHPFSPGYRRSLSLPPPLPPSLPPSFLFSYNSRGVGERAEGTQWEQLHPMAVPAGRAGEGKQQGREGGREGGREAHREE